MFELTLETDNAAFDEPAPEIARLLREAATMVERGALAHTLRDVNGNTVGRFHYDPFASE